MVELVELELVVVVVAEVEEDDCDIAGLSIEVLLWRLVLSSCERRWRVGPTKRSSVCFPFV